MSRRARPGRHRTVPAPRHRRSPAHLAGSGAHRLPSGPTRTLSAPSRLLPSVAAAGLLLSATGAAVTSDRPAGDEAQAAESVNAESVSAGISGRGAAGTAEGDDRLAPGEEPRSTEPAFRARGAGLSPGSRSAHSRSAQRSSTAVSERAQKEAITEASRLAQQREEDTARPDEPSYHRPVLGAGVSSHYGWRWGRLHAGMDYATASGSPLYAVGGGTVVANGYSSGLGYHVKIRLWDDTVIVYGHLSSTSVSRGQEVAAGTVLGYSGNTGNSTGPHLHLEVRPGGGGAVDPASWLAARGLR